MRNPDVRRRARRSLMERVCYICERQIAETQGVVASRERILICQLACHARYLAARRGRTGFGTLIELLEGA